MINIILALLGIAIFFIVRYKNRKTVNNPTFGYWLVDNWEETVSSLLATTALLIMFLANETSFDLNQFIDSIPYVTGLPLKLAASFLAGYGNTALLYKMFNNKTKK